MWLLEDLLYNGAEKDAKHSLFNHPMTFPQRYHHVHFTGKETKTQKGEINCPRVTQFLSRRPTKNIPGLRDLTCRLPLHSLSQMIPDEYCRCPPQWLQSLLIGYLRTQVHGRASKVSNPSCSAALPAGLPEKSESPVLAEEHSRNVPFQPSWT